MVSSHWPAPFVNNTTGTSHVRKRENLVIVRRQDTAPGVEDHHGLGAGIDLRVEVMGNTVTDQRQQSMQ